VHIWTNRPYEAMWDHLDFLAHPANVEGLLSGKIKSARPLVFGSEAVARRKAAQVAYSIRQGHEYFRAADSVSITTSPVLYYYGVLALSKALLVANSEALLLDDVKYHGLHSRPVRDEQRQYEGQPDSWSMEQEFANTRDGVFKELTRLIHGFSLPDGSTLKYGELLAVEPEISDLFNRYYGVRPRVQYLYEVDERSGPYQLTISPRTTDKDDFESRFPRFETDFQLQKGIKHGQALVYVSKPLLSTFPDYCGVYGASAGGRYLVGGVRCDSPEGKVERYFRPEVCDYANLFILSNCARYKQQFWVDIAEGKTVGAMGLISVYVNVARARFPNFILNQLFGEAFSFGAAGWLV
jgi:hypothetical protein